MADAAPVTKKPEVLKAPELPAPVQESLTVDLSFIDKIPKDPKRPAGTVNRAAVLCWFGTLPAVGPVPQWKMDRRNNVVRDEDTSALAAWTHPERKSEWHGKCSWFQNISVRGLTFPAFSNYAQRSGFESPNAPVSMNIAKAGAIGYFTEEQIQEILFECAHTMVKPADNPRAPHTAEIFRLVEEVQGGGKWIHPDQDPTRPNRGIGYFDPERDKPVADYVYFMKIQNEFQQQDIVSIMKNPLRSLSGR